MATIDYFKSENTQKNVLTNLYNNVEKKQKKLLEQTKENAELLEYLSECFQTTITKFLYNR